MISACMFCISKSLGDTGTSVSGVSIRKQYMVSRFPVENRKLRVLVCKLKTRENSEITVFLSEKF